MSPLESINRTQVTNFVLGQPARIQEFSSGVAIPDVDALFLEMGSIRIAADEPEQLLQDSAVKDPLCSQQRKSIIRKTKSHLGAKNAFGTSSSTISTDIAFR
jgi:hypothetical protein